MSDHVRNRPAITVLGDVTVRDGDGLEQPLTPQRREILAVIAAAAGGAVPTQRLLDGLWATADRRLARKSLKTQVSVIRQTLAPQLNIEFENGGYRLKGPLDLLDATRFEQLVIRARDLPALDAAPVYTEALSLWRGRIPYANVENELVSSSGWRLQAMRDEAVLALADAEIATRHGRSSVSFLEEMFAEDATRGDIAVRLAKLYAIADRQLDGIEVLSRHRSALADVGAVVAPDVLTLESQILRHELTPVRLPPIDRHAVSPATLPRSSWADRVVSELATKPVMLVGDPGVGKSTLVRLITRRLEAKKIPVVRAAVLEDPFRPMQPIADLIDALQVLLPRSTERALRSKRLDHAAVRVAGGHEAVQVPATTREELLTDLTDLLETAITGTGAVIVVEDAHWLDATSAEILTGLLERRGIHVLLTSRIPTHPMLERSPRLVQMQLPPFDLAEVSELLQLALPLRATDDLAATLHHQTGGNALFVALLLDVLSRGDLGADVPATLQAAVVERTSGLARTTRELLQLASLLGQTFPIPPLHRLRRRAAEQLSSAEEDGLIQLETVPTPGLDTPTSGRFVHGLVADALAAMVPAGSRVSWHDELCRALIDCGASAVAVAPQAVGAASLDPIRAAHACRDAAEEYAALFEWGSAATWARAGLDIVDRFRMTGTRIEAELRTVLGVGLRRTNLEGSDIELLRAAELASEFEADELLVRAVIELCLHGFTTIVGDVDGRARRHLDYALSLDLPDQQRAELLAAAATLLAASPEAALGRELYHEARSVALRSENERLVRSVLLNAHLGLGHPDDLELRRHAAHTLSALDDVEARWEGAFLTAHLALVDADRAGFDLAMRQLHELTPQVRRRSRARALGQMEAVEAFVHGDLILAERRAHDAFETAIASYSASWAMSVFAALLIPVRLSQGQLGELWDVVADQLAAQPTFTAWHALGAVMADDRGDCETVAALLGTIRERELDLVEDTTWTAIASMLCIPVWRTGDLELARTLRERLAPHSGTMTWNGLSTHGPVDAGLALLAATLDDQPAVDHHLAVTRRLLAALDTPHLWWPVLDHITIGRPVSATHLEAAGSECVPDLGELLADAEVVADQ